MQRMITSRDRGAVAVWIAILLVPFLVVTALAVDIAAMATDRQRLQVGADAAALAIAQDCARAECGDAADTARQLAGANDPFGGPASATLTDNTNLAAGRVEVQTSSQRDLWFAPIIGLDDAELSARAAATWGTPGAGTSTIPFIFSTCQLDYLNVLSIGASGEITLDPAAIGAAVILRQSKGVDSGCDAPYGNNFTPGGFGWIATNTADCSAYTEIGDAVPQLSGNSQGSHSHPCYQQMRSAIDSEEIALLPVFETANAATKSYIVKGYIAVTLERYRFQGGRCYAGASKPCSGPAAGGNEGWVEIIPQRYIASDADFEVRPGAPNLGTQIVQLRLSLEG